MTEDVARAVGHPPRPITVVVTHHREADRESLVRWLSADDRFDVRAEVGDAGAITAAIEAASPVVALVDIDLPDPGGRTGGGIGVIDALSETRPATRTVLVADEDDDRAYAGVAAGASGCYLWTAPLSPITNVVAGAARGEGSLTPGWAGRLIDEMGWLSRESNGLRAPELSPTELEVVRRVASGATPAAIAALHGVTEHVVNLHAGIVLTKVYRHHDDSRRLGVGG
jgi:DNA-binding NarL/FixJ family response regulator